MSHLYAVILAGGSGTRLWPRSRRQQPKQLLDLLSERTMLQETYERIAPLASFPNVFVITNREYIEDIHTQLPEVPLEQIIGEPEGRGTAPPAALAALLLQDRDPEAVTIVLPADHAIPHAAEFRYALRAGAEVANQQMLVTLGIKPQYPETGYGYVEAGEKLGEPLGLPAYRVKRFTEKPDLATAEQFVADGNYYWNSGIFIWRASTILEEFSKYLPAMRAQLEQIVANGLNAPTFEQDWRALQNETLDFGIMEQSSRVATLPLDVGWNDVGSWAAILDLMERDADGNAVIGHHIGVDTQSSLIYSKGRLIATVGLENMIIVDAGDVLLVCRRDRAQEVKQIVDELKRRGAHEYL